VEFDFDPDLRLPALNDGGVEAVALRCDHLRVQGTLKSRLFELSAAD
jgi:hypothetical protein